jgi:DNA-binding transcriptional regulator LsrR (DeoR family)
LFAELDYNQNEQKCKEWKNVQRVPKLTNFEINSSSLSQEMYRLCLQAATLYYEDGLTQGEIAKQLGYSRTKIHRVLQTARDEGIVQIQINTPDSTYFDLERKLVRKYDLRDALVVQSSKNPDELYRSLVEGTVSWLKPKLEDGIRIGLGLGRTISHLPEVFEPNGTVNCIFTEVVGAASDHNREISSYNITSKMAERVGGKAEFFYAPTYVSSPELKAKLINEPSITKALDRARQSDIILQSVGPVDESALLYLDGCLSEADLSQLREKGAVGDALGHYFDREGNPVPSFVDQVMIGLDLKDLTRIPWSVVIAGGTSKVPVIEGALKGDFFNVVITDADSAARITRES